MSGQSSSVGMQQPTAPVAAGTRRHWALLGSLADHFQGQEHGEVLSDVVSPRHGVRERKDTNSSGMPPLPTLSLATYQNQGHITAAGERPLLISQNH